MAKIESVLERQRGAFEFDAYYRNLCALENTSPLPQVRAHLQDKVLDFNADRIRVADWTPILGAIGINKTLEFVAVRSYFQNTIDEQEKRGYNVKRKIPAIRSKEITFKLCGSLKASLSASSTLQCLELQGLPLRTRDIIQLAKGIRANGSLQHLSLEYSRIGDDGLAILCGGIKNAPSVSSLNFAGCSLSWKGAEHLSQLVQHQAMQRHNEAWKDSLRYRRPDLDRMAGIRRITLNRNPLLADQGAKLLAEALKDDLWLKALDVQFCGLTDIGAKYLVDVLKYNTCIVVLDVRNNPMIGQPLCKNILEHLMINNNGQETEFKWLASEPLHDPARQRQKKKRTKTLQNNYGRKTTIKIGIAARRRSRSVGSPAPAAQGAAVLSDGSATPGIPWRTALRANRARGYPPDHSPGKPSIYQNMEGGSPVLLRDGEETTIKIEYKKNSPDHATDHTARAELGSDTETELSTHRGVRVEIEQLRRRLKEETKARSRAEARVIELTVENNQLKQEIDDFRARQNMLDDEVLANIEQTFTRFFSFLDFLKEAGLGQIITMAGIDQLSMPFTRTPSSNGNSLRPASYSTPNLNKDPSTRQPPPLSNRQASSKSDPALQPKPKMAFPQITPQNYQSVADPTAQKAERTENSRKPKSKFDELYQKAIEDTEGALQKSLTEENLRKAESNGLYTQGTAGSGIPLYSARKGESGGGGDVSDHSHHSRVSHKSDTNRPLSIMDLREMEELPTTEQKVTSKVTSTSSRQARDASNKSIHQYTDTFEKTDSGSDKDIEEVIDFGDDDDSF